MTKIEKVYTGGGITLAEAEMDFSFLKEDFNAVNSYRRKFRGFCDFAHK